MPRDPQKWIKSSYKYVGCHMHGNIKYWQALITGEFRQTYETEKQAATGVDKYLISIGKEPVNILKRK